MTEATRRRRLWIVVPVAIAAAMVIGVAVFVMSDDGDVFNPPRHCDSAGAEPVAVDTYDVETAASQTMWGGVSPNGKRIASNDYRSHTEEIEADDPYKQLVSVKKKTDGGWRGDDAFEVDRRPVIVGINDSGSVVGTHDSGKRGWVVENGDYRKLLGPNGSKTVEPTAIAKDGTIVGFSGDYWHNPAPLRWEPGETYATALRLPKGLHGVANEVLDDGTAIGDLRDADTWRNSDHADAWIWDTDGDVRELSTLIDMPGKDGEPYSGKEYVADVACDWLLLKVQGGGMVRTTLSGDGRAEFVETGMDEFDAPYSDYYFGSSIDSHGRVYGAYVLGDEYSTDTDGVATTAGIFGTEYETLPGLDSTANANGVIDVSDDGCVILAYHDREARVFTCRR